MSKHYDLAVVGAGIVGLGVALAGARAGKKVVVIDRSPRALGASVRNFGFVTVTGQSSGEQWQRAMRARDIWADIAPQAGIDVLHSGVVIPAYRAEAADVLAAFMKTEMAAGCEMITREQALEKVPSLNTDGLSTCLYSPYELRVESREAVPKLALWLETALGVDFRWSTAVTSVDGSAVSTSRGKIHAEAICICPGDDFSTLQADRIAAFNLSVCTLQMLRIRPSKPFRLASAVMSDLSLARYGGFASLAEAGALKTRLDRECTAMRAAGVHVIAVQSADGSLVIGDSHVYGAGAEPFASEEIDALILEGLDALLTLPDRRIIERWTGTYASSSQQQLVLEKIADNQRLVIVTSGTGASTAFALGEEIIADLFGPA